MTRSLLVSLAVVLVLGCAGCLCISVERSERREDHSEAGTLSHTDSDEYPRVKVGGDVAVEAVHREQH